MKKRFYRVLVKPFENERFLSTPLFVGELDSCLSFLLDWYSQNLESKTFVKLVYFKEV